MRKQFVDSAIVLLLVLNLACGGNFSSQFEPPQPGTWFVNLSLQQVEDVRLSFPDFEPERFAPGTDPRNRSALRPSNFTPAKFFGLPSLATSDRTPIGIVVHSSGYLYPRPPEILPSRVTYYDPWNTSYDLTMDTISISPRNKIEERLGVPYSALPNYLEFDRRRWHTDLAEVDRIMLTVRDELAIYLPAVGGVDPTNCEIIISSTIFWVPSSNFGPTWAGGLTENLGNQFRITLVLFYISGDRRMADWRMFLVDEAINFYVISIGRGDLAR